MLLNVEEEKNHRANVDTWIKKREKCSRAHGMAKMYILCFSLKCQRHNLISIVLNNFALVFSLAQPMRICALTFILVWCILNVVFSHFYTDCESLQWLATKKLHCKRPKRSEKNTHTHLRMNHWAGVIKMKWTPIPPSPGVNEKPTDRGQRHKEEKSYSISSHKIADKSLVICIFLHMLSTQSTYAK